MREDLPATASEKDYYTWEPPRSIPTSAWTEYRADFALIASDQQWTTVAAAFGEFDGLNWHVTAVIELRVYRRGPGPVT